MDYLLILIICEYYFYMLMISLASNNKQKHPIKNVASQMFSQRFINIHIGRHTWYLGRRFLFCLFCLLFSLTYMFFLIYFLFFQSYVFSHSSKITKCLFLFVFFSLVSLIYFSEILCFLRVLIQLVYILF